jgi:sporulation protein YlmC with PRC-barrel domain
MALQRVRQRTASVRGEACGAAASVLHTSRSALDALLLEEEAKMLKTLAYATLFTTALIGSSAYAADNSAAPKDQPPQAQPASGVNFVTRQEKTQWRAPKLVGVGVYGPDDKQIGKIDDLLMDRDGAAQTVVIGVGGFLGFGKKDVAVPFSTMQWRTEVRKVPANDQPTPMTGTSGQQPPPMKETDPAATEASQGYPDKAILNVTLDELKAAPDFKYASSTLADSAMQPAGADQAMKKTTP